MASEQMDNRLEPCCDSEAEGEPIEQHHEHEEYRYRPHFPILSPTPSVAPAKPRKLAAVCLTRPGRGCSHHQHQQRCGQQHSHRFLLRLGQRRSTPLASLYTSRESGCKRIWST